MRPMPRWNLMIPTVMLAVVAAAQPAAAAMESIGTLDRIGRRVPKCEGRRATIIGTSDRDRLEGTRGADVIVGLGARDHIRGLGGDDLLCGGHGIDAVLGGPGNDVMNGGLGSDQVAGSDGADELSGGPRFDLLHGGEGDDSLRGGKGFDLLTGGADDDELFGQTAPDALAGGPGIDRVLGGSGGDFVDGGLSDDTLVGGRGLDAADFSRAKAPVEADLASGTASGQGRDTLGGVEALWGSRFDDVLRGDDDRNFLAGDAGDDVVRGEGGRDLMVDGSLLVALVETGSTTSSDYDLQDDGIDVLDGGPGRDTASMFLAFEPVVADLGDGTYSIDGGELETLTGVENLAGSFRADRLTGDERTNRLIGSFGRDRLTGGDGDDQLLGGFDADVVRGEAGDDRLDGGRGIDRLRGGDGTDACARGEDNLGCEDPAPVPKAAGPLTVRMPAVRQLAQGSPRGWAELVRTGMELAARR